LSAWERGGAFYPLVLEEEGGRGVVALQQEFNEPESPGSESWPKVEGEGKRGVTGSYDPAKDNLVGKGAAIRTPDYYC